MEKDEKWKEYMTQQISKLGQSNHAEELRELLKNIEREFVAFGNQDLLAAYKKETAYQENEFSAVATEKNVRKARDRAVAFLEQLLAVGQSLTPNNEVLLTKEVELHLIRKLLNNFYLHMEAMYEAKVHKKAHITKEKLSEMRIGNEYDVQRILYSLLRPIFPKARLEVPDDAGYGSVRYDIVVEECDAVIEVKCSRPSMTERMLTEELASDIYHYQHGNVFFFIYDKDKIISNRQVFAERYSKDFDGRIVQVVVIQPVHL